MTETVFTYYYFAETIMYSWRLDFIMLIGEVFKSMFPPCPWNTHYGIDVDMY